LKRVFDGNMAPVAARNAPAKLISRACVRDRRLPSIRVLYVWRKKRVDERIDY
jgi:hypothetical protein